MGACFITILDVISAFLNSTFGVGALAQIFSLLLTFLFVVSDIYNHSNDSSVTGASSSDTQVGIKACAIFPSLLYFLTFATGNAVATLLVPVLSPSFVQNVLLEPLDGPSRAFVYAVLGVVGYEVIISNLTLYTFGQEISLNKSRSERLLKRSVEDAVRRQIAIDNDLQQKRADLLERLVDEEMLNAHIITEFGSNRVNSLEDGAHDENAKPHVLKAHYIAALAPDKAQAIINVAKKTRKQRTSKSQSDSVH